MTPESDWGQSPLELRLSWLRSFRTLVAAQRDALSRLIADEVGKTEFEALTCDLLTLLSACAWHEKHARSILSPRRLRGLPLFLFTLRQHEMRAPLGRVGIIATWNYPVQLLGIELVQALVAGNTVMVKPSEFAPRTQLALLKLAVEAGLPEGVLTWTEATREAGPRMLASGRFDHVVFTGSTGVGRQIAAWAAERLIPTTLELSGRDSAFVLADADVRLAASSLWQGVTMNSGQTCMAPRRILVEAGAYAGFVAALGPLVAASPKRRLIDGAAATVCHEQCVGAVASGGRSITGVLEAPGNCGVGDGEARDLTPIAIVDCPKDAALVEGRHFGPVVAVVKVAHVNEALAIHRQCDQHLSASIFTRDKRRARALAPQLGATNVLINDSVLPTGSPVVGIGGVGMSGWGVTRGRDGLLAMTRPVFVSTTMKLGRFSTQTPPASKRAGLQGMLDWLYGKRAGGATGQASPALVNRPAAGTGDGFGPGGRPAGSAQAATVPTL